MKKILIVNPFGIGDAVFSMVVAEAIRKAEPDAFIGFMCNERTAGLVRLNRAIDGTYVFNRDHFRKLWAQRPLIALKEAKALWSVVKNERFDILLDYSLGREFCFYAMLAGIPQRVGLNFKGRGIFLTHKKNISGYEGRPVADIQLGLLDAIGVSYERGEGRVSIDISDQAKNRLKNILAQTGIRSNPWVAIAPGGGKSWGQNAVYKQWDAVRFAETANRLAKEGEKAFVFLGGKDEEALLRAVADSVSAPSLCLAGAEFDVVGAALLGSRFLLCNDGGLLHLANALGVKTVSLFGPVDASVYGPYGNDVAHKTVTEAVPCRPCYHRFHFPPCGHERQCLTRITPDLVLAAIKSVDSQRSPDIK